MKARNFVEWFYPIVTINGCIAPHAVYHIIPGQRLLFPFLLLFIIYKYRYILFDRGNKIYAKPFIILGTAQIFISCLVLWNVPFTGPFVMQLAGMVIAYVFILLHENYKIAIFKNFISIYSVLLIVSMVEYLLILGGHHAHSFGVVERATDNTLYTHYFFNLIGNRNRFQSIFDEPGDIGTMNGLLLFIIGNDRKFKFHSVVIVLSGLMSLSFAFYVLFAIYMLWMLVQVKIKKLIILIILMGIPICFSMGELITLNIVDRFLEERYDNRTSLVLQSEIDKMNGWEKFFGKGIGANLHIKTIYGQGSDGLKVAYYEIGYIGIVLLMLAFCVPYVKINKNNICGWVYLMAFWLSFYQRAGIWGLTSTLMFFTAPYLFKHQKNCYEKRIYECLNRG